MEKMAFLLRLKKFFCSYISCVLDCEKTTFEDKFDHTIMGLP